MKFMIRLKGSFHAFELYDGAGRKVYTLEEAVKTAEAYYADEWSEVYNGQEGQVNDG